MLEVEARISQLGLTFLGEPIGFTDQLLYFQSKSVLEVFQTLINTGKPDMWVVGVLVLMFSIVFPTLKVLTLTFCLFSRDCSGDFEWCGSLPWSLPNGRWPM